MKKTALLALISLLTLTGCGNTHQSGSNNTATSFDPGTDVPPTSDEDAYSKVVINYTRLDGVFINRIEKYYKKGENYRVFSPEKQFMAPSQEVIIGTADGEDHYYNVYYDYAPGHSLDSVSYGQQFNDVMIVPGEGFSFSFALKGAKEKQPLFVGEKFTIYNGTLEFRTSNPYTWSEASGLYCNGASKNALISTSQEMFITFSFNKDESVTCYKNGQLIYYWAANLNPEAGPHQYHFVYEVTQSVLANVEQSGFRIGSSSNGNAPTYTMTRFSMGNAVDDKQALERYNIDYLGL